MNYFAFMYGLNFMNLFLEKILYEDVFLFCHCSFVFDSILQALLYFIK